VTSSKSDQLTSVQGYRPVGQAVPLFLYKRGQRLIGKPVASNNVIPIAGAFYSNELQQCLVLSVKSAEAVDSIKGVGDETMLSLLPSLQAKIEERKPSDHTMEHRHIDTNVQTQGYART